uniref:Uncharacterized protein n=1 Tax=Caenorhabditis japonica TaxID=281687 RepID=A0A8R1ENQ4_CAEJA
MALADKMKNSSLLDNQLAGYEWDNFYLLNKSMNTFIAETQGVSSKLLIKEFNLKSLADAVSSLDNVKIPPLNLEFMVSSLDRLKSSSLELSLEVAALKQSIKSLEGLEYAFMRKQGALPKLIARAASFFKSFFSKQPEVEW